MITLTGCGTDAATVSTTSAVATSTASNLPTVRAKSLVPTDQPADFPISTFSEITQVPVPEEMAAKLQAALAEHDVAGGGGMSATVMTAQSTRRRSRLPQIVHGQLEAGDAGQPMGFTVAHLRRHELRASLDS